MGQWWRSEFPDAGANVPDRGLNQRGRDHASFIISLFEGWKHHVIFRKANLNFWLETVCFRFDESITFLE